MRHPGRLIVVLSFLSAASLIVGPSLAFAQSDPAAKELTGDQIRDAGRESLWIPSATIFIAGLPEERTASADSDTSVAQDGETVGFPWSVGGELELASPVLFPHKLKPRLTIRAGSGLVIDAEDPVTTVGEPGPPPRESPFQSVPEAIENVGSAVRVQAKNWLLTGGVGAQLELEAFDRTIYLRPSLEWMYRKDTIRAILGGGEGEVLTPNTRLCNPCRTLFIDAQTEKGYHSLGMGLEAEVDGTRAGPLELRFFLSGRVYHVLGDRKTAISPSGSWVRSDNQPSSRADTVFDVRYEREPWHYRFGAGVRILWMPE